MTIDRRDQRSDSVRFRVRVFKEEGNSWKESKWKGEWQGAYEGGFVFAPGPLAELYKQMYNINMPRSYSIADARAKLAEIIDEVEGGEDVEIVRRGKKVAVLVSPARYARMAGEKTAFGDAYDAFMQGRDPKIFGLDTVEFEKSRDRTPGRAVKF